MVKTTLDSGSQRLDAKCVMTEMVPQKKQVRKMFQRNLLGTFPSWCGAPSLRKGGNTSINNIYDTAKPIQDKYMVKCTKREGTGESVIQE